jgi:hypothetical protein
MFDGDSRVAQRRQTAPHLEEPIRTIGQSVAILHVAWDGRQLRLICTVASCGMAFRRCSGHGVLRSLVLRSPKSLNLPRVQLGGR